MTDSQQLREQLWDLVYGLLSSDESAALIAHVKSDPQVARLYAEVRLQADLVGYASRVEDSSLVLNLGEPVHRAAPPEGSEPAADRATPSTTTGSRGGANWLIGSGATALTILLAVGFLWPRLNE